jgi:cytosine/adenosine deaminase-related metal-dependent hydrolase
MYMYRQGPLHDWLKGQRDMSDCGHGSPVAALARCGYLSENLLAAHVNHLTKGDAELLAGANVSVVHCPSSHRYFKHLRFPRPPLTAAGVNLCLGTDSLASTFVTPGLKPKLDLFREMQLLAQADPDLSPSDILRMATLNGAKALGQPGLLGELSAGALADLIVLDCPDRASNAADTAVHHPGPVRASMIDGRWVLPPPELRPTAL